MHPAGLGRDGRLGGVNGPPTQPHPSHNHPHMPMPMPMQMQMQPIDNMHEQQQDGIEAWLTNGHNAHQAGLLPEFDVPYTPYLDGPLAVKNDLTFMSTSGSMIDTNNHSIGQSNNMHTQQATHTYNNANANNNGLPTTDDLHGFSVNVNGHYPTDLHQSLSMVDSSTSASTSSSAAPHTQYIDATFSKPSGMGNIGHLGSMAHTMDPAAIYNQQFQPAPMTMPPPPAAPPKEVKQEPQFNHNPHQPSYSSQPQRISQRMQEQLQRRGSGNRAASSTSHSRHSSEMDYVSEYNPNRGQSTSDQHSIASDSSAASTPDLHLVGMSSSAHSSDRSSNHTSPLVSSPDNQPETPAPLHTISPVPLDPHSPPQRNGGRGTTSNQSNSRTSSVAGENATGNSNNGLVSTLQSATDVLLNVNLYSGSGKKKSWPTRTISLQSLNNPSLSYSQLLFHAANISTFVSVSVDDKDVPNAQPNTNLPPGAMAQHVVSIQDHPSVKARIEQLRAYAHQNGNGSREHSNSSSASHSQRSRRSTPTTNYTSSGQLDFPPFELTFQLAENVKSCTRLGCWNLLVNKANRRACNICQSHGAEINPTLLRRLVISPHHSATQYAYLEQILEDFEYWKFDSVDDPVATSAAAAANAANNGGHAFPFVNQIGYYIAFIDSNTAAHVTKDFNHKVGYNPSHSSSNGGNGNGNGFMSHNSQSTVPPMTTAICEVDLNYTYAIKMKSHFWMLEVKPKQNVIANNGGAATRLKSKFYKKVGKPNQSRVTAAAAAMAAQQQAAAQVAAANGFQLGGDFNGGGNDQLMSFNRNQLGHKRRFDDTDSNPVANMLAINHISINMAGNKNGGNMNMLMTGNNNGVNSTNGGATIELLPDAPDGPTNTVHVSDTSFRVMKNQPVSAMMSVHDTAASSDDTNAASASSPSDTVDSKPLVNPPVPVVLIYRDVDAYQRDALVHGFNGGGGGGNGNNSGNNNNGGNGFNNNNNNNNNFNNGNNNNNNNNGSNKRGRFDTSGGGMMNAGLNNSFSMATVATPVLGLGMPAAMPGLNAASMAGVAAAMNQFQLAQVAQAQMQQSMLQQVAMDYGRFPAPWVFQDRAAAVAGARRGDQHAADIELQKISTNGFADEDSISDHSPSSPGRQRLADEADTESNGDGMTFDDADEAKEDGMSQTRDGSTLDSRSGQLDIDDDHDGALDIDHLVDDGLDGKQVRVRIGGDHDFDDPYGYDYDPALEGHMKPMRGGGGGGIKHRLESHPLMLIDDEQGNMPPFKPTTITKTVVVPEQPVYRAFNGKGPASDFLKSFHFFQQSFWGVLTTLLFGLVALIILIYNVRMPDPHDSTAMRMQLLSWRPIQPAVSDGGSTSGGSGRWAVPPGRHHNNNPYDHEGHTESVLSAMTPEEAAVDPTTPAELLTAALGVTVPKARQLADTASVVVNGTDTNDPLILSRRLYVAAQLFTTMRDTSSIINTWSLTSPAVIANMLNPPPGSPAVVNVDVMTNNCNSGVRIGRAIGDFVLSQNGLLAAFGFMAAPATLAATTNAKDLCTHLSTGVGPAYMYQLTCQQWIASNRLSVTLPSGVSCTSSSNFEQSFSQSSCETLMATVKGMNLTNVFFTPYNTSLTTSLNPTVYYDNRPTSDVPQTKQTTTSTTTNTTDSSTDLTAAVPLTSDAEQTLRSMPHLAAMSFYGQALDLRTVCINFGVTLTLVATTTSTTTVTITDGDSSSNDDREYRADGILFGLVALGALGMFFILQMVLFVTIIGVKGLAKKMKQYIQAQQQPSTPRTNNNNNNNKSKHQQQQQQQQQQKQQQKQQKNDI